LKRERQEARARQRVEYLAAIKIQSIYRSHLCRQRLHAVAILKSVLRSQANHNALTAAFWAAKKITKFSSKVGREFRIRRKHQAMVRYVTTSTWLNIKATALANTLFRSQLAHNIVTRVITVGLRAITRCVVKAKQHKQAMMLLSKGKTKDATRRRISSSFSSPMSPSAKPQPQQQQHFPRFHLRSFRRKTSFCDSWYNPATETDYSSQAMTEGLMSSKLHSWSHEERHFSLGGHGHGHGEGEGGKGAAALRGKSVSLEVKEEDERQRRLALLHQQREEEMEAERQKRLLYIEEVSLPSLSSSSSSFLSSILLSLTPLVAKETS
jgi:hypothetical protein